MRSSINRRNYFLLIAISPVLALYKACKANNWVHIKYVGLGLSFIYGMTLNLSGDEDVARHLNNVEQFYVDMSLSRFFEYSYYMMTFQYENTVGLRGDLYIHALSYLAGGIIGLPKLLLGLAAMIYAYFFIGSIEQIFKDTIRQQKSFLIIAVFIYFVSFRFIDNFQTIRTWTGMWVMTYGLIRYYKGHGRRYIVYVLSAPLIHLGYFVMALPVYAMFVLKKMPPIFFIAVCSTSFFIEGADLSVINWMKTNDASQTRAGVYFVSKEDSKNRRVRLLEDTNVYTKYADSSRIFSFACAAVSIVFFGYYRKSIMNELEYVLMGASLMLVTLSNLAVTVYALHNRTLVIATLFVLLVLVSLIRRGIFCVDRKSLISLRNKLSLQIILLLGSPYFLFVVANNLNYASWGIIFMPIVPLVDSEISSSLKEVILLFL